MRRFISGLPVGSFRRGDLSPSASDAFRTCLTPRDDAVRLLCAFVGSFSVTATKNPVRKEVAARAETRSNLVKAKKPADLLWVGHNSKQRLRDSLSPSRVSPFGDKPECDEYSSRRDSDIHMDKVD